jgi:hypothetical protein
MSEPNGLSVAIHAKVRQVRSSTHLRQSIAALIVLFCVDLVVFSQVGQKHEPGGTVEGRVTANDKPVRGCVVVLWRQPSTEPPGRGALSARTDAEGHYHLTDIPAGNYYASVSAPGFFELEDGKPAQTLRTLSVAANETPGNVNFELARGAAITGRVTGVDDKPIIEMPVTLIRAEPSPTPMFSQKPSAASKPVNTDDRGIYRIYGLPPGHYKIAAGDEQVLYTSGRGRPAYPRSFYPDAREESRAKIITVSGDSEISGIDIKISPAEPVFSISGKITDQDGLAVAGITIGLRIFSGGKNAGGRGGSDFSNQRGEFIIANVPSGRYSIYVPGSQYVGGNPLPNYFGESDQFDVSDQDVTGIVLKAERTASVSGNVVLEGSPDKITLSKLLRLRFILYCTPKSAGMVSVKTFTIGPDRSFAVDGLTPGLLRLSFGGSDPGESLPFGTAVLELNGSSEPIEIKAGDTIVGLKVRVVYATGGIRGVVKFVSGTAPANIRGTASLYNDKTMVGYSLIDERGNFLLESIPAGNYRLVVAVNIPGTQPNSGRSEQMIEVSEQKLSDVVIWLDPKPASP